MRETTQHSAPARADVTIPPVPRYQEAQDADVGAAARRAVERCIGLLDPTRVLDVAVTFVAGYALSELHAVGLTASPHLILEVARAALGRS